MNQQNDNLREILYEALDEKLEIPTYMREKIKSDNLSVQDLLDETEKAIELTNKIYGN